MLVNKSQLSRLRIQRGNELTTGYAQEMIKPKDQIAAKKESKKLARAIKQQSYKRALELGLS